MPARSWLRAIAFVPDGCERGDAEPTAGSGHTSACPTEAARPVFRASVPKLTPVQEAGLVRRPCGADFRSYCQGTQLGEGRAVQCLVQNESRLSPTCKQGLAAARRGQ